MVVFRRFAAVVVSVALCGCATTSLMGQAGPGPAPSGSPVPSLFLVSNGEPAVGSALARLLDGSKIHVVDRSAADVGLRATTDGGSWAATLAQVRPGDFVLIQFARKDGSAGDMDSLPGVDDGARRIAGTSATGGDSIEQSYGWYLRRLAVEAIAHGATPILCAPMVVDAAEQGRDEVWAGAIAMQQRIPFADVPAAARQATSGLAKGTELAEGTALVSALRGLPQNPLAGYFSADGKLVAPYRPPPAPTTPLL